MITRRTSDKALLESLVNKYGKINIINAINESRGAALDKRTGDRFFGDKYNRPRDLKTTISKSLRGLREFESYFTDRQYEMLETLIDNINYKSDPRSHANFLYKPEKYCVANFYLVMNNMPRSIINKLSENNIKREFGITNRGYRASVNGFGVTQRLNIEIDSDYESTRYIDVESGIELIKYVLDIIEPIFDDIISFTEDYHDRER